MNFLELYLYFLGMFVVIIRLYFRIVMVVEESVVFDCRGNLTISWKRRIGIRWKATYSVRDIDYFFIHEAIKSSQVFYYIGAKQKDSDKVIVLFPHITTPLRFLLPIYHTIQNSEFSFFKKSSIVLLEQAISNPYDDTNVETIRSFRNSLLEESKSLDIVFETNLISTLIKAIKMQPPHPLQLELEFIIFAIHIRTIGNEKSPQLSSIINHLMSVHNGTYTPSPGQEMKKPKTTNDIIAILCEGNAKDVGDQLISLRNLLISHPQKSKKFISKGLFDALAYHLQESSVEVKIEVLRLIANLSLNEACAEKMMADRVIKGTDLVQQALLLDVMTAARQFLGLDEDQYEAKWYSEASSLRNMPNISRSISFDAAISSASVLFNLSHTAPYPLAEQLLQGQFCMMEFIGAALRSLLSKRSVCNRSLSTQMDMLLSLLLGTLENFMWTGSLRAREAERERRLQLDAEEVAGTPLIGTSFRRSASILTSTTRLFSARHPFAFALESSGCLEAVKNIVSEVAISKQSERISGYSNAANAFPSQTHAEISAVILCFASQGATLPQQISSEICSFLCDLFRTCRSSVIPRVLDAVMVASSQIGM
eukprot:MONOS_4564.1-p1 / transcript=MONOS_4564.1 / gene=MONOS_4564 / organism=Monocercomonoides_exilis_PA203 / gene_product=unspecified product / transcript_product=unspecified product / location=Mono_scaffold00122:98202-100753(+) / protein_length=596 / sequence_SO=supercontig / SO=protein_coding / is_pseudo=false